MISLQLLLLSIVFGAGDVAVLGCEGQAEPADALFGVVVVGALLCYCVSAPGADAQAYVVGLAGGFEGHGRSFLVCVAGRAAGRIKSTPPVLFFSRC